MVNIFSRIAVSLALGGAFVPIPVLAAQADEQAPTVTIHYGDLDLATARGAKTLEHRIARASMAVCPDLDFANIGTIGEIEACRANALANAKAQADVALAKVRANKDYASTAGSAPSL